MMLPRGSVGAGCPGSEQEGPGGHDDCFLIIDRVGDDFVVGVRAHTGEVLTVYLMAVDIEKLVRFLCPKDD